MIAFPKPRHRIFAKLDAHKEREKQAREVANEVKQRDGYHCRCCGRSGVYDSTNALKALHRHHIAYRSKGGPETAENIVTLCARCHAAIHGKQLFIVGLNANRVLQFEIHEAAVVEVFGTSVLPKHVRMVA